MKVTQFQNPNLQIFCRIHFTMELCIITKNIIPIVMKNLFQKNCLINAQKYEQGNSSELQNTPKNPTFFGD